MTESAETDASGAAEGTERTGDPDASYSGIFGAFPYALRASESRLMQSYILIGGLLTGFISIMFLFAVIGIVARTTGSQGGVFTFSRAFFVFVGFLVVFPLVGPIISTARRHRRGTSSDVPADRADYLLATTGYLFIFALYLGLVISTPEAQQQDVSGVLAPVASVLYSLPRIGGLVPPVLAGLVMYLAHRYTR
jgi:hypothetical protein